VVGEDRPAGKAAWLFALGMLGMALRLGRRRSAKAPSPAPARTAGQKARRALRALTGIAVIGAAGSFSGCSCGGDEQVAGAQYRCDPAATPPCTTLEPGLIGAYTSAAVSGTTIWVAGYAEANLLDRLSWGDLAVGKWEGDRVAWSVIDGVPAEPAVDPALFNKNAFRGGQTEPGDDVGLWTSIAVDDAGKPAVAYYDRTHKALKFAQSNGSSWSVMTVETKLQSDIGRYAKLLFVGGKPIIAYLAIEPGKDGAVTSKVRLATGTTSAPTEADWTFEDVAADPATPCRAYNCAADEACIASTGLCTAKQPSDACAPKCSSGTACVDQGGTAACAAVFDAGKLDTYPDAYGNYVSMAKTPDGGVGIAFYDRLHTNLVIARKEAGAWKTLVVDGATPDGATDTGDMGIGTSLFIDDKGDWHLSYADGLSEGMRYAQVTKGSAVKIVDVADDGLTVDGTTKFTDGQHIVGDDSRVHVAASGEIHITYQDATAGQLRYAVGTPSGDKITWKLRALEQEGFAGAFSAPIAVDGKLQLLNWWRVGGQEPRGDVSIISP
jgi:hypothetical protein